MNEVEDALVTSVVSAIREAVAVRAAGWIESISQPSPFWVAIRRARALPCLRGSKPSGSGIVSRSTAWDMEWVLLVGECDCYQESCVGDWSGAASTGACAERPSKRTVTAAASTAGRAARRARLGDFWIGSSWGRLPDAESEHQYVGSRRARRYLTAMQIGLSGVQLRSPGQMRQ